MKKQKKTSRFRINARNIFLTYPKCDIPIQLALNQLQDKPIRQIQEYVIVQEDHLDGSPHLHVYLQLERAIDTINPKVFDLIGTDKNDVFGRTKVYHGNYQGVKSQKDVISYIIKDVYLDIITGKTKPQKCLISHEIALRINKEGKYLELDEAMMELAEKGRIRDAMSLMRKHRPKEFLRGINSIERNLRKIFSMATEGHKSAFDIKSFYIPKQLQKAILEQDKLLWIQGDSGIGKTQAIQEFLKFIGHNTLRMTDLEAIKNYNETITMLLYDDVPFHQILGDTEKIIHYLDIHNPFEANIKFATVTIPPIKKIVLSNKHPAEIFSAETTQSPNIKRRITYINLQNIPLFTTHVYFLEYMKLTQEKRDRIERRILKEL